MSARSEIYERALPDLMAFSRNFRQAPTEDDLQRWANGAPVAQALDAIGERLAVDYLTNILAWEFCDWVANSLWHVLLGEMKDCTEVPTPPVFWPVFLAFDNSEDNLADDPEHVLRQELAMILRKRGWDLFGID